MRCMKIELTQGRDEIGALFRFYKDAPFPLVTMVLAQGEFLGQLFQIKFVLEGCIYSEIFEPQTTQARPSG